MEVGNNIETFDFLRTRYPRHRITKVLLDLNDISQADLARETGLKPSTVYGTLNHYRKNPRVMAAVSRKLGIPARELFDRNGHGPS